MLCRFSNRYVIENKTSIDNLFILDYLPYAPDLCVKVYILGLANCYNAGGADNDHDKMAKILNVAPEDIVSAFLYWQDKGLVQVIGTEPLEVVYLPVNTANIGNIKKYKVGEYADFNIKIQDIIKGRMISKNEYTEYYALIESMHMDKDALLKIAEYCVQYKGDNVGYSYITTVAKNWAYEGVQTADDVQSKIESLGLLDDKLTLVLKALGKRKVQTIEDKQYLDKWIEGYGFDLDVIIYVAKTLREKKQSVDLFYLDNVLTRYFENKLMSVQEIDTFETEKKEMYHTARLLVKNLGLYYDDLTKTVETYIIPYRRMGYDDKTLVAIADYAYKNSIRKLELFDDTIKRLYKLGVVDIDSFNNFISQMAKNDEKIKEILHDLGMKRKVNETDRKLYTTWTEDWGFSADVIAYACTLSRDKGNPIQYLNKILSLWHGQGINTVELAKTNASQVESKQPNTYTRQYTQDELSNVFTNIDEIEV